MINSFSLVILTDYHDTLSRLYMTKERENRQLGKILGGKRDERIPSYKRLPTARSEKKNKVVRKYKLRGLLCRKSITRRFKNSLL